MDRTSRWLLVSCIIILMIGSFMTYEAIEGKDASMRKDLLSHTVMASTAVNVNDIKALTGSAMDLNTSEYQQLKVLMEEQRAALPTIRFVYLLGQHANGTLFFFIDSEPADSPDNSPPGQIYEIDSVTIDEAFLGKASTGGPLTDQWGVWMSSMVPIIDPDTGEVVAVLGMDVSANNWMQQTIEAGLVPGLTTVLILTLVVIFYIVQKRRKDENRRLSEAAEALRESSEKYRTLIENSQDVVFILQDGRLIFISPAIQRILGSKPEEMLARTFLEFVAPEDRDQVEELTRTSKDRKGNVQLERVRLVHQKAPIDALVALSISNIDYQGRPAYMGTFHDLTAKERAETALAEANRKLQLMTGITRHDILNQLMVLRGNMELAKDAKDIEEAKVRESRAMEAVVNIENMITFTKDYQEIGINMPIWQDVHALVRRSTASMFDSGLDLRDNLANNEILADPLIVKVFHNLIDNTLRHGESITRIDFSSREEDGSLLITIQDDGVGVREEDKGRIFERGFGKHTGLGLFFSREVLSITRITINEEGEPGKGAKFVLRVPSGKWRPLT